jgi:hypothetical protein
MLFPKTLVLALMSFGVMAMAAPVEGSDAVTLAEADHPRDYNRDHSRDYNRDHNRDYSRDHNRE